ncbi:acyl-CoA dehydrogenase [Tsuneonella sp. CC-YZS046]|uniref:acyl-CoA dehydrogenase n=1 Tax=Tsuneonella sp. CC-YZS046 TaxID=3042152 RepID=UPI002D78F40F|nr:acyl-CoA dehydrogenase [Tsuneonella sp. CC-YZS046]WRO66474.1 acyl-CoA dehydrogenase [Tsuneonella sp. CC-YZS046]
MDFNYSEEEQRFRSEVRAWLADALPKGWGKTVFEPEDEDERAHFRIDWERKLYEGGWSGISWPKKYGGRGATLVEQGIFAEELARAQAPEGINVIGRNLAATTLMHHGSEAQRERYLPKILSADEIWCQGFSEPNAGSDLASSRCRADLDGDEFVINGQKIWTSFAQYSQWCILLARTDQSAPKHKGLSFFLVDMSTPGITIRPLTQISGEKEFNETFFENVRIPKENLVGELNDGWRIAMTTLSYERGAEDALARQIRFKQELDLLIETAGEVELGEGKAIDNPAVRQRLAQSIVDLELMRMNCLREFSKAIKGEKPGPESSMMKLYWSHVAQDMADMSIEILGPEGLLMQGDEDALARGRFPMSCLQSRAFTIYSGTSEIQRNIIAERVLGLPK